jgi:hypothetical protein
VTILFAFCSLFFPTPAARWWRGPPQRAEEGELRRFQARVAGNGLTWLIARRATPGFGRPSLAAACLRRAQSGFDG